MKIRYLLGLAASLSVAPQLLYGQTAFQAVLTAGRVIQDSGASVSGAGAFATFFLCNPSFQTRSDPFGQVPAHERCNGPLP